MRHFSKCSFSVQTAKFWLLVAIWHWPGEEICALVRCPDSKESYVFHCFLPVAMEAQAKLFFVLLLGLFSIANFASAAPALKKTTSALEMPSYKAGEIPVMVIQDPEPPFVHIVRSRDGLGTETSTSGVKGASAVRRTDVKNGDNVREEPRNPGGVKDDPPMQYKVRPEVPPMGTRTGAAAGSSIKKPGKVPQATTSAVKKPLRTSSSSVKG